MAGDGLALHLPGFELDLCPNARAIDKPSLFAISKKVMAAPGSYLRSTSSASTWMPSTAALSRLSFISLQPGGLSRSLLRAASRSAQRRIACVSQVATQFVMGAMSAASRTSLAYLQIAARLGPPGGVPRQYREF